MNGNAMVRLPVGSEWDIDLYGDFPLFSVVRRIINGTANKLLFFNYIQGESIPGVPGVLATELDTNLDKAAKHLGYMEEMMIHSIAWQLPHRPALVPDPKPDNLLLGDMVDLIDKTYFAFKINNKLYHEGTLDFYPFPGGLYVVTTQNDAEYVNNGVPQSISARPLAQAIHITGKSTLVGLLEFPYGPLALAGAAMVEKELFDYLLRCWLLGIRARYQGTTRAAAE